MQTAVIVAICIALTLVILVCMACAGSQSGSVRTHAIVHYRVCRAPAQPCPSPIVSQHVHWQPHQNKQHSTADLLRVRLVCRQLHTSSDSKIQSRRRTSQRQCEVCVDGILGLTFLWQRHHRWMSAVVYARVAPL